MSRTKHHDYTPSAEFRAAWPGVSGNAINGLGEYEPRRASPMFWHPPDMHPYGAVAKMAGASVRENPAAQRIFEEAYAYPPLVPIAERHGDKSAEAWTAAARAFALAHEADLFGATPMREDYIFEGYDIAEPHVIVLGLAHDYDEIKQLPSTRDNAAGVIDVGRQYARGTRASYTLANWIRAQGFSAHAYPGPRADALLLIPAAIAAGLGELGKHGSMINRTYGSGFRLAGVTTDMPLVFDHADDFGADEFCARCQVCTDACPPGAILPEKQTVRGTRKWYVDFDACIPYFAEFAACGLCIAVCPWTRPGVADNLLKKMARRRERREPRHE